MGDIVVLAGLGALAYYVYQGNRNKTLTTSDIQDLLLQAIDQKRIRAQDYQTQLDQQYVVGSSPLDIKVKLIKGTLRDTAPTPNVPTIDGFYISDHKRAALWENINV